MLSMVRVHLLLVLTLLISFCMLDAIGAGDGANTSMPTPQFLLTST
jgi:hypothetical protein